MSFNREVMASFNQGAIADENDRASVLQMIAEADAQARQINKRQRPLPREFDGIYCNECGDAIAVKRIEAMKYTIPLSKNAVPHQTDKVLRNKEVVIKHGTELCINCATDIDVKSRQFA